MSAQSIPDKSKVGPKLREYQMELNRLKEEVKRQESVVEQEKDRSSLFSGGRGVSSLFFCVLKLKIERIEIHLKTKKKNDKNQDK